MTYTPVDDNTATSLLGEGIHTGLRKGSEAPSSTTLWRAISDSDDSAWADALAFCVEGLREMGYVLCKQDEGEAVEGYVWCDHHGMIHDDTLNPFGYADIPGQDLCTPEEHFPVYRRADDLGPRAARLVDQMLRQCARHLTGGFGEINEVLVEARKRGWLA